MVKPYESHNPKILLINLELKKSVVGFEVWNEPDGWPNDQLEIFTKCDVFVDAVKSVDSELRVGGPACYQ